MKILPYSRFAYEPVEEDQASLFDVLAEEGGSWVWRHDNGFQRDYFVGSKKVLQYFVKPTIDGNAVTRTVVAKQWISKDILASHNYQYQEYGEGGYAIMEKLRPVGGKIPLQRP
jgi:hypothetical protein